MKLTNYNPLRTQDSIFDDLFMTPFAGLPAISRIFDQGLLGGPKPLMAEFHEDSENFYANFEIPGVKKDQVQLDLNHRLLTVTVEKKSRRDDGESSYKLTRSVSIPDSVDHDKITAKLEDGVLVVTMPKSEERKPRRLEIS